MKPGSSVLGKLARMYRSASKALLWRELEQVVDHLERDKAIGKILDLSDNLPLTKTDPSKGCDGRFVRQ
jgi:hypothetical protein